MADTTQDAVELIGEVADKVSDGLSEIMGGLNADAVFGIEEIEGRYFITAAAIERGGGFGFGGGAAPEESEVPGGGGGGGGGGSASARPVALIEITQDDVKIRPVFDYTRVGLTVLISALTAWRLLSR